MAFGSPTKRLLVAGTVLALAAAACGSGGGNDGTSPSGNTGSGGGNGLKTAGKAGGTLYLPMVSDFEHLDPTRAYVNTSLDFDRLLVRSLTTYKSVPGKAGNEVVGDLATDTGTPSDGGKTWSFTLRDGLKYEDGSPIKCEDVKYGVSRTFDPDLPEGPPYFRNFLANVPKNYKGPKKSGDLPDSSIACDGNTITFHLNTAVGDFPYTVSLPYSAPVPKAKDTGTQYDNRVFSSGPYKIESYTRNKSLVLVRNKYWDRSTDPVRGAYPDKIECTFGVDPTVIDQRLIADSGNDQSAIIFDSAVQPSDLSNVLNNPQVKARSDQGLTPFVLWIALNTQSPKLKNLKVRQALEYLVNKESIRTAAGGKTAGEYAYGISQPNLPGSQDLSDLYPAPPTGDVAKAKQLLQESGVKLPLHLTFGVSDSPSGQRLGTAVQEAFKRANVQVDVNQIPRAQYYTVIGNRKKEPDMVYFGWGADWPSMSTVIPPLFAGYNMTPQGNLNVSQFDHPDVDAQIKKIQKITDVKQQAQAWGELERKIMEQAPVIPYLYEGQVLLRGSKVKGAYFHAFFGLYDLVSLSVA